MRTRTVLVLAKLIIFIGAVNIMKNEKASSQFQKMKDAYLSRKENPEIIRPEDMRDDEYLRYTIRKKWREEGKGKEWLKNLEDEEEKREQEVKIPLRDHVDIDK